MLSQEIIYELISLQKQNSERNSRQKENVTENIIQVKRAIAQTIFNFI